jgi:aspartokinase/homoserine dehydrogenase 1
LARLVPADFAGTLVITGFIAIGHAWHPDHARPQRQRLLRFDLRRAAARPREIVIWTDVDGVLSADPRRVPDAKVIDSLSYNEAMELAYFGAKVIHPQTMAPAVAREIPICIKQHLRAASAGHADLRASHLQPDMVKGITTHRRQSRW